MPSQPLKAGFDLDGKFSPYGRDPHVSDFIVVACGRCAMPNEEVRRSADGYRWVDFKLSGLSIPLCLDCHDELQKWLDAGVGWRQRIVK
jgi:hypothetical protein